MALIIDQLTKQYADKVAVDGFSLILQNGVYGLLGANGAGKTTLMRMLCGVLKPTSGHITFRDFDVSCEYYRSHIGYLPQDFGYYPEFTAMDFMLYLAALKGMSRSQAKKKSLELLELVSLSEAAGKKIKIFSGGMKQRLGIAQSMLNDPQVLILDEPTAGLDPKERIRFRNMISQLGKDRIVLLSTHIVSDIEYIAGTILIMKNGRLIHHGSLSEIIAAIEGSVWECSVSQQQAEQLMSAHPSTNVKMEGDIVSLRLVSDQKPCENALLATAGLEDLYLYYFSEVTKND